MKKRYIILFLLVAMSFNTFAQNKPGAQSIYLELGGAGLPYSFNYDFRFDKTKIDSWGMRMGVGGYALSGSNSFFSVPVQVNKLYGKNGHYFEVGGGFTFLAFNTPIQSYCRSGRYDGNTGEFICDDFYEGSNDRTEFILKINGSPNLMATLNFGYRRVPTDGGFMWKVNLNPIFNSNGFWPLWAGIGFGYAF